MAISENPADKSSILVLKKLPGCAIIFHAAGMWLSLVERCVRDAKATGSNPAASTNVKPLENIDASVLTAVFVLKYILLIYNKI